MKKRVVSICLLIISLILVIGGIVYYSTEKVFIDIKGKDVIQLELGTTYDDSGAVAKICHMNKCSDITDEIIYKIDFDNSKIGEYELLYEVEYKNKIYSDKRVVNVVDLEKPVITLNNESITLCPSEVYKDDGKAVAIDNYDGDLTDSIKVQILDDNVLYTVSDSSDNVGEAKKKIVRKDVTKPVIKLSGSSKVKVKLNDKYVESGYTVTDNCNKIEKTEVTIKSNVDTTKEGTYNIQYSVKDKSGNVGTANRTVVVQKPISFDTLDKKEYVKNLEKYISSKNYNVSIGYVNLNTGYTYLYRNNVIYYGASLAKTVDALYVYEKMDFDEATRLKVKKAISVSDNTAHSQLVKQIGIENLRKYGRSLGASNFLTRSNSDYYGNTTVNDQIAIWKHVYKVINTNSKGKELKQYFINSFYNHLLFDGIPTTMHKYGYYGSYYHDVGIVYAENPYLVVILTKHGNNNYQGVVKDLSKKIYGLNKIDN